ncbi:uncharacterized protein E0L32_010764 [Thyridium curvatum]|uniref:RRM domain-containing protein n=1 Tax=Thyridium curvatum TaxID=1093900 RepID=A0A507AFG1_9PEZI|nr:uncharacterized protein E0L32_010764 [Thyridium curvatum]TPX07342.1 hypothetical protein E0L32_010764 [Thyridium curvatum]
MNPHDPHHVAAASSTLINSMGDPGYGAMINQFHSMALPADGLIPAGPAMAGHSGFVNGANPNIVFASPYSGTVPVLHDPGFAAAAYTMPYPVGAFGGAYSQNPLPYTPGRAVGYSSDRLSRDVPDLENRRASYSTSGTESSPATPFGMNSSDRITATRIASNDRSLYTTPSPRQGITDFVAQGPKAVIADPELERLLMQDPPIPKAVPAVWTEHLKSLDQCLENRITGNRNVYIRGLHPTTDDDLLSKYAERFGEVEQSKAIIDTATGACKGFGFAKFKDVKNSEKCIRGFYRLGYEVGFARVRELATVHHLLEILLTYLSGFKESFNARLKAEGDDSSTNLYISNLPRHINESMLASIFEPFHIVSSKILRDSMGNSRGVGFARFESRDVCEQVIDHFHGIPVGEENFLIQVRYADTPAQKELKRITAERRQYRTNEYNIGAYGTHAVGMTPTIYASGMWGRRSASVPYHNTTLRPADDNADAGDAEQGTTEGTHQCKAEPSATPSEAGTADEGVTIVDSPAVKTGSSSSSPVKKD